MVSSTHWILQRELFIKHNLGQFEAIHKHDRILPFLTGLVYGSLREMACRHNGAPCERLQASPQFRHFLSPNRMQPSFCLNLNHSIGKYPHSGSCSGVHVNTTVCAESCRMNIGKSAML